MNGMHECLLKLGYYYICMLVKKQLRVQTAKIKLRIYMQGNDN